MVVCLLSLAASFLMLEGQLTKQQPLGIQPTEDEDDYGASVSEGSSQDGTLTGEETRV